MESQTSWQQLPVCSGAAAKEIGKRCIEIESRGTGDVEAAMHRLQSKFGIDYWLWHHWRYRAAPAWVRRETWDQLVWAYRMLLEEKRQAINGELERSVALWRD